MASNYSSNSTGKSWLNEKIIASITVIAIPIDILVIMLVVSCKSKLIRTEYYILLQLNVLSFLISISALSAFVSYNVTATSIFNQYQCFIINIANLLIFFLVNLVILYYSVFHLSFLSRAKWMLKLKLLIENANFFLIYFISLLIVLTGMVIAAGIGIYRDITSKIDYNLCFNLEANKIKNIFIMMSELPMFLAILVYSIAGVLVLCNRLFSQQKYLNTNEKKRFRRNFLLVVKFFIFTILNFLKTVPMCLLMISFFYCERCHLDVLYQLFYVSYLCYIIQPFFLIFIQSILKKQFIEIVFKFFNRN